MKRLIAGLAIGLLLGWAFFVGATVVHNAGGGGIAPTFACIGPDAAGTPCYSWLGDENTGIFSAADEEVNISTAGVQRLSIDATDLVVTVPWRGPDGTAGAPAVSFSSAGNTDNGLFLSAANEVSLSTAGVQRLTVSATFVTSTLPYLAPGGTALAPSHSFTTDGSTGIYFEAGGTGVGIASAGVLRVNIDGVDVVSTVPFRGPTGTAGTPTFTSSGDSDTGMFASGANAIGFSTDSTLRVSISNTALAPTGTIDLGTTAAEWNDLFLGDAGRVVLGAAQDVILGRDAANVLGLRNGVTAQEFNIYNSDSGANDEYARFSWAVTANIFRFGTETAGTGVLRDLLLERGVGDIADAIYMLAGDVRIYAGSSQAASFVSTGIRGPVDNTNDLGTSAIRWRVAYLFRTSNENLAPAALAGGVTTIAVTTDVHTVDCDAGGNTIATITGGLEGQRLTLIFVDASCTLTDTAPPVGANQLSLSAAFTSSAEDTMTLVFNGTGWLEVARAVN